MSPLELLKKNQKPLGVHTVATPELAPAGEGVTAETVAETSVQHLAELSGEEFDVFADVWSEIREKFSSEESLGQDYRRVAIAFCWCDRDRNRYYRDTNAIWEVAKALREQPSTLTLRMYKIANGANAFQGIDDETKKNSRVVTPSAKNDAGNGESPSPSESPRASRSSRRSAPANTPSSDTSPA